MSDYTPTTEEIRRRYSNGWPAGWSGIRAREFDRWLAEHDREVAEKAWQEGFSAGKAYGRVVGMHGDDWDIPNLDNPYREVSK